MEVSCLRTKTSEIINWNKKRHVAVLLTIFPFLTAHSNRITVQVSSYCCLPLRLQPAVSFFIFQMMSYCCLSLLHGWGAAHSQIKQPLRPILPAIVLLVCPWLSSYTTFHSCTYTSVYTAKCYFCPEFRWTLRVLRPFWSFFWIYYLCVVSCFLNLLFVCGFEVLVHSETC